MHYLERRLVAVFALCTGDMLISLKPRRLDGSDSLLHRMVVTFYSFTPLQDS